MQAIYIKVSNVKIEIKAGLHTGAATRKLAGLTPDQTLLLDNNGEVDVPIYDSDFIVICGGEKFVVDETPTVPDNPCYRNPIGFVLNGNQFIDDNGIKKAKVTGAEIKKLDPSINSNDNVYIEIPGAPDELLANEHVLVVHKQLEFLTVPCGNVGDLASSPILDQQFSQVLERYPQAVLSKEGNLNLLTIDDYPIPKHWSKKSTTILISVPSGYPSTPLNMFYVSPSLTLANGQMPNKADITAAHLGITWQRFSWHYQSRGWNPSQDRLLSHLSFCDSRLAMNE